MIFDLLCDAHNNHKAIWSLIPVEFKFGIIAAAVLFVWGKYEAARKRQTTGSGITNLSQEEQMLNFVGTQQMHGNEIVHVELTDNGFDAVTRDENGNETGWSIERRP